MRAALILATMLSADSPRWGLVEEYVNGSGVAAGSISSSNAATSCESGDLICRDRRGDIGGIASGTTDPMGVMVRGKQCSPTDNSCTSGNVSIAGGSNVVDVQIDGADPSATCAGDNDFITFTVVNAQGTAVISAVQVLEGTDWTATASVADTCASLAAGVETKCTVSSVDYCNASCVSPEVEITLTPAAAAITLLTESTAGCTTVATLSPGNVNVYGAQMLGPNGTFSLPGYSFLDDPDTGMYRLSANTLGFSAGGASLLLTLDSNDVLVGINRFFQAGGAFVCTNAAVTCADGGNPGVPAACTLANADIRCGFAITCSDADGCAATLDETSAVSIGILWITNVSANNVTFDDSAGVQETNGGLTQTLGQYDVVPFIWAVDRWQQAAAVSNN